MTGIAVGSTSKVRRWTVRVGVTPTKVDPPAFASTVTVLPDPDPASLALPPIAVTTDPLVLLEFLWLE